jgi:tetratricopeptide (TPR) repeat protein
VLQREAGYLDSLADTLDSIGYAHHRLGHHADAIASCRQALDVARRQLNRRQEADTLIRLSDAHVSAGHQDPARDLWQQALGILDDLGRADADEVRAKLAKLDSVTCDALA